MQKTAYELRISDCSADVCSSDLIAAKHHIEPLFVLFDSCWDPNPKLGPQHPPIPGVHNSGWVQAPGAARLADKSQYGKLEAYVKDVVGSFAHDKRVLGWDVWNEQIGRASCRERVCQ